MLETFKTDMKEMSSNERREYRSAVKELGKGLKELFSLPQVLEKPVLIRQQYGQSRWINPC